MKRVLLLAFAFLFTFKTFSNTVVDGIIKLPKQFKVENTFSGDLSENKSFHLIFSKNKKTKKYTVHSYIFDGENTEEITPLLNDKACSVVSFHQKDDVLTLLLTYKKKKDQLLKRVNINLKTKEVNENLPVTHEDFVTSFREKNRSVLVYENDDKLVLKDYSGADSVTNTEYVFNGKKDKIKTFLKDNSIVSIKTDEFVANGSTSDLRGYLNGKKITLTKENTKKNTTEVLHLNYENNKLKLSEIISFSNSNGEKNFKKSTSYLNEGKLFQLGLDKKNGKIKVSDIQTKKTLNTINLDSSISSKIRGNKEFENIETFLKNAGKNKYNSTITVNKTSNNKVRIRVGYVDKSYNYHYNWWWHHQQFMMWQNQQFMMNNARMSVPSGFGPNQLNDEYFENATVKEEKRHFDLLIDVNGFISEEDLPETIYTEINKKEYIDKLEEISDLKNESSCFLKDSFRYIGYSKKLKGFIIKTNRIKE